MTESPAPLDPLLSALNAVMRAVGFVQKDKKNTFHGYKYAGEEALLTVLRPALVENGLVLIPSLDGTPTMDEHGNTNLTMAYTLAHISGAVWPEKIRVPGCGNDRAKNGTVGDKGAYKALTGANKYMLFKLFQIATGDDPEVESDHDKGSEIEPANGKDRGQSGLTITDLKASIRSLQAEIHTCQEMGTLDGLLTGARKVIADCEVRIPKWWEGSGDIRGLKDIIADKRGALVKPQGITKGATLDPWDTGEPSGPQPPF